MAGPGEDWDAQKMLDCYIYDYMKRKNMHGVAEIFSQEANVNDMPPVVEGFLTDWWSILWETHCARMRLNSGAVGESSSSSVQPNNVMENSHQIIYQDVPMPLPDHQPGPQVPPGVDLDTMLMGQQPPPYVLATNNYQEEHHPYLLQAEAEAHAVAHASSSSNTSLQQLQALQMAPKTQQEVPHSVPQQGVSLGRSMTSGGAPYGALPRANQQNSEAGKSKAVMLPSPPRPLSLNVQQENEYYKDGKEDEETSMYNRFNHLEISQESDGQADGDEEEGAGERPKLPEGFYEIEAVRKKRTCKGVTQYLIKWLGWPESANTWEPLENLQLCSDVIEEFEASLQPGKGKSGKKRKSKSKSKRKRKH